MPTRRHLLATVGIAAAGSGCMGVLGDEAEEAPADSEGAVMDELSLQNNHEEAHEITLAIESDGDVLHLGTYDLEAGGTSVPIEGEWNTERGVYRIHARLDDGEIRTVSATEGVPEAAECVRVLVRVDQSGVLGIWSGADCE